MDKKYYEDEVGEEKRSEWINWVKKYCYKNYSIRDVDINSMNKVISFAFHDAISLTEKQTIQKVLEIIDKLAKKEKAVEIDIGEYDKFISVHNLKQQIEEMGK